jgi:hypothetical protein
VHVCLRVLPSRTPRNASGSHDRVAPRVDLDPSHEISGLLRPRNALIMELIVPCP